MERCDVLVVGGGAAGLMAAGRAATRGLRVTLLERNDRVGKKVRITGKGRCNVTNACELPEFLQNVPHGGKFLYGALHRLSPADTMAFFEGLGVPLKVERGNRVFPLSDRAGDIVEALQRYAQGSGASLAMGVRVKALERSGEGFLLTGYAGERFESRAVVLATGGLSYPGTGSTGDGYRLARGLGHTIVPPGPALVPLEIRERELCREMQGLSLRNVALTVREEGRGKPVFSELGEMLFTHFGVSGPLVLSASSRMERPEGGRYSLHIDLKPGLSPEQLDARLLRDFGGQSNKNFANALGGLLPAKLIPVVIRRSGIPPEQKVHQVSREQRRALAALLKDFSLTVDGFRPAEEAIVTTGGVALKEVNPKTMESKCCPGLFLAGELLDIDGYTGGFNLQIAFSTGAAAGESVCLS